MAKASLSVELTGDQLQISCDLDVNKECNGDEEVSIEQVIIWELYNALRDTDKAAALADFVIGLNATEASE